MDNINKFYTLNFKLLSPIHIGLNQRSFSNHTRLYIPGWTIAGAVIKNYCLITNENIENFYNSKINNIFFSTFFFKEKDTIFYPNIVNKTIGNISISEFESKFLEIRKSTSINPENIAAQEENLFEFEYIWENDLEVVGKIGINKDIIDEGTLFKALNILEIGAKISKGFGRLCLIGEPRQEDNIDFFKEDINLVPIKLTENLKFKGEIEALSLNRFDEKRGYGQKIDFYGYYVMPGSVITNKEVMLHNYFAAQ